MPDPTDASAPSAERPSEWYSDPDLVLGTLRDTIRGLEPAPTIEGYEIVEEIARGGQGLVYLAVQRGTRRRVAIKVLLDRGSPASRRRFEREVELVAALDHPNIVKVYDGRATADGKLYLVMEFVDGTPLERHVASVGRDPRRVAELMRVVAEAVHAAHCRGVIHRDLKPSNILVDADGRPHIVDFGLARAPGRDDRHMSLSVTGQFLGSLPWASPEQAAGTPDRIDVRSDIYSLGVLLHQSLTGEFPYEVDGALSDALHNIATAEPSRPSARRRDLTRAGGRDLDAITLTALAKDPERRYQSAADLAADLRAYLAGEPVRARADGAITAMAKALRRYRLVAAVASVLSIALLAATLVAIAEARAAERERLRAQHRFDVVRDVARGLLFDVHDEVLKLPGSRTTRERIVTAALGYLRDVAPDVPTEAGADNGDDLAFLGELASAWEKVADIQGNPALPNLGQTVEALASYDEAIALRERVRAARPDDATALRLLGRTIGLRGYVLDVTGDSAGARDALLRAAGHVARARELAPTDPSIVTEWASNRDKLSTVLVSLGDHDGAVAALEDAEGAIRSILEVEPNRARWHQYLAIILGKAAFARMDQGRPEVAIDLSAREVEAARAAIAEASGPDARASRGLSIALNNRAWIESSLDRLDDAEAALTESLAIITALREADPQDPVVQGDVAYTLNKRGSLSLARRHYDAAEADFLSALEIRRALKARDAGNASARRGEIVALLNVAETLDRSVRETSDAMADAPDRVRRARALYVEVKGLLEGMQADGTLFAGDERIIDECDQRIAALAAAQGQPEGE